MPKRKLSEAFYGDIEVSASNYRTLEKPPEARTEVMAYARRPLRGLRLRRFKKRYGAYKPKRAYSIPKRMVGFMRREGNYGRFQKGGGEEIKFFEDTQDVSTITTAGIISHISLNRVAQADTEQSRDGRKITIVGIQLRGHIEAIQGTSEGGNTYAIYLYQDTQCNGATALVSTNAGILFSASYNSFLNLANTGRFKILKKWYFSINKPPYGSVALPGFAETHMPIDYYTKCNIPIEFDATAITGAITTIRSNNIGIMAISQVSDGSTLTLRPRIRYRE